MVDKTLENQKKNKEKLPEKIIKNKIVKNIQVPNTVKPQEKFIDKEDEYLDDEE